MDTITSAEFRKSYAKLTAPTIVTANGHPIGVWNPATPMSAQVAKALDVPEQSVLAEAPAYVSARAQAQIERDAILRRISKGV